MVLDRLSEAVQFASSRHASQKYPGTSTPYVAHLWMVSILSMDLCRKHRRTDLDVLFAGTVGALHDIIEDSKVSHRELANKFGRSVADGVLALSKNSSLSKYDRMPDSLRRIREQRKEVWLVKIADRICNLESIHRNRSSRPPKFAFGYLAESQLILSELGSVGGAGPELLRERIEACRGVLVR